MFTKTNRRRYTGQQLGTKSGRRPADKPVINRWSTAGFVPPSVYIKFSLFVLPGIRPGGYSFDRLESKRDGGLLAEPTRRRPVLPVPAPPSRRAPPRPDPGVLCPGFGFDKINLVVNNISYS